MAATPTAAQAIALPDKQTNYPPAFAALVAGRLKRKLGDHFGLTQFGINLTELAPGAISALLHHHSQQDEFIYVLEGNPTLILADQEYLLKPGDCMGFKAATGYGHQLINRSKQPALYLEVGDRAKADVVDYPNDDLKAQQLDNGQWGFSHKNGQPY
ncbi:MAG: cupin domain-containing protein [Methylococcaceae bacterium]|jgi:uncharacterized cupin superfamily protein